MLLLKYLQKFTYNSFIYQNTSRLYDILTIYDKLYTLQSKVNIRNSVEEIEYDFTIRK